MSELITVARPYAKAAFDFALEHQQLDKWQEMLNFAALVAENKEMNDLISSSLSVTKIAETFIAICGEQLDQYGQNFIRIMAENKRLVTLPSVFQSFMKYRTEYESTKEVEVISAKALNETQKNKIALAMEKRLNCKVRLISQVDSSLMGGIIIRFDDVVIDGSSRGQLNRLANELCL